MLAERTERAEKPERAERAEKPERHVAVKKSRYII